jgi:hypothetical protein
VGVFYMLRPWREEDEHAFDEVEHAIVPVKNAEA